MYLAVKHGNDKKREIDLGNNTKYAYNQFYRLCKNLDSGESIELIYQGFGSPVLIKEVENNNF